MLSSVCATSAGYQADAVGKPHSAHDVLVCWIVIQFKASIAVAQGPARERFDCQLICAPLIPLKEPLNLPVDALINLMTELGISPSLNPPQIDLQPAKHSTQLRTWFKRCDRGTLVTLQGR